MKIKKYYIDLFEKYLRNDITVMELSELKAFILNNETIDEWMKDELMNSSTEISMEEQEKMWRGIKEGVIHHSAKKKNVVTLQKRMIEYTKWAAILILPLLSVLFTYYYLNGNQRNMPVKVYAQRGEKAIVSLPDGTKVWLNSESTVSYDNTFNHRNRKVSLVGEAYFEVRPDKTRPFIVETKALDVQALGTKFNVRAFDESNEVTVVLLSGKVKVYNEYNSAILMPNEAIRFNTISHSSVKSKVYAQDFTTWKDGVIRFNNEDFESIARTLSRIYNVNIVIETPSLKKQKFTGIVGSSGLNNILNILSMTSTMEYRMKDSTTIALYEK
ncbi:MAG: FecR family protein [Bacteroidales bacterium]|nr:FecR family protein [Bacteroidales bacterium]